jgi:hypothetical protein
VAGDVGRALSVLEEHLSSRPYLLGDDFSLADCAAGVMVNLLRGTRVDTPAKLPAVTAYRERIRERIRERTTWNAAGGAARDPAHELPDVLGVDDGVSVEVPDGEHGLHGAALPSPGRGGHAREAHGRERTHPSTDLREAHRFPPLQ